MALAPKRFNWPNMRPGLGYGAASGHKYANAQPGGAGWQPGEQMPTKPGSRVPSSGLTGLSPYANVQRGANWNPYTRSAQLGPVVPPKKKTGGAKAATLIRPAVPQGLGGLDLDFAGAPPGLRQNKVVSSIPRNALENKYLQDIEQPLINLRSGQLFQKPDFQGDMERRGATPANQASATSGQGQAQILAKNVDPYQNAALLQAQIPMNIRLQKAGFSTQIRKAQADEVRNLTRVGLNYGGDALNNYNRQLAQHNQFNQQSTQNYLLRNAGRGLNVSLSNMIFS